MSAPSSLSKNVPLQSKSSPPSGVSSPTSDFASRSSLASERSAGAAEYGSSSVSVSAVSWSSSMAVSYGDGPSGSMSWVDFECRVVMDALVEFELQLALM